MCCADSPSGFAMNTSKLTEKFQFCTLNCFCDVVECIHILSIHVVFLVVQ